MPRCRLIALFASLLALNTIAPASAQQATPISIPTVTASGCGEVRAYRDALEAARDASRADWVSTFPDKPRAWELADEELGALVLTFNTEELRQFAALYDRYVAQMEEIEAPAIAAYYHAQLVETLRLAATMFNEAAAEGLIAASLVYNERIGSAEANAKAYGEQAAAICPAFGEVLALEAEDSQATPSA